MLLVAFFYSYEKGMGGGGESPALKNMEKETGIIRAAAGIKEISVITATSARGAVLLLLLLLDKS